MRSNTLISVLIASLAATPLSPPFGQNSGSVGSPVAGSDNNQASANVNRNREGIPPNNNLNTVFGNQFPESQSPPNSGNGNLDTQAPANVFGNQAPESQAPPTSGNIGANAGNPSDIFGNNASKPQSPPTSDKINTGKDSANVFGSQAPSTSRMNGANPKEEKMVTLQKQIADLFEQYMKAFTESNDTNLENMPKSPSDGSINTSQSSGPGVSEDSLDGKLNGEGTEFQEGEKLPENDSFKLEDFGSTNGSDQDKTENSSSDIPNTNNRPSSVSDNKSESINKPSSDKNANKANDKPQNTEQASPNSPNSNQSSNTNQTPSPKVEIQSNRVNKVMLAEGPHGF
jgi:hypothetical protein